MLLQVLDPGLDVPHLGLVRLSYSVQQERAGEILVVLADALLLYSAGVAIVFCRTPLLELYAGVLLVFDVFVL